MNFACIGDVYITKPLDTKISSEVIEALNKKDVVFANCEGSITDRGIPADKWAVVRQNPKHAKDLLKLNVNAVIISNNHTLDYGEAGLLQSIEILDKLGIKHVGAGRSIDEALAPAHVSVSGVRVAFIGCASTLPFACWARKDKAGVAPIRVHTTFHVDPAMEMEMPGTPPVVFTEAMQEDVETVQKVIKASKRKADFVVFSIHWGMPYQTTLMDYQVQVGHAVIDAGADLVLGYHPHILQAIEKYRGKYICYSVGDFLYHLPQGPEFWMRRPSKWSSWPPALGKWERSAESLIVQATLKRGRPIELSLTPVVQDGDGVVFVKGDRGRAILGRMKQLSGECNATIGIRNGVGYTAG